MSERIRVLHVDDGSDSADRTARSLERAADRLTVETAVSADEALDSIGDRPPDCVLSDYDSPGRNAIELLEAVREDHPDLPFVLVLGDWDGEVASDAISAGVTDCVQKRSGTPPFELLANRIERSVDRYHAERELERQRDRLEDEVERRERVEVRYRSLFENFPEPTFAYVHEDGERRVVEVNEAVTEVFGFTREEALSEPIDDLVVPPESRDEARHGDDRGRSGEATDADLRRQTADGPRDFRLRNVSPAVDDEIDGYAVYVDVTDRRERNREANVRAEAMEASIDGMAILDSDGTYVFVNRAHADSYGYDDPDAFLGETWRMCYGDDEVERFEDEVLPALAEEGSWQGEAIGRRKDGSTFPQELSLSVSDEGRIICVIRDVTERKERERELELYRTMVDTVPDAVYAQDEELQYIAVNEGMAELTGYSRSELVGSHLSLVVGEEPVETARENRRRLLEGDAEMLTHEYSVRGADGGEIPVENRFRLLPSDDGEFRGTAGVIRDISDRLERERELERRNERLEQFARFVSHDLRNPLTVLDGSLELAERTGETEHFERCRRAVDRMDRLIEDLLTLAREGGTIEAMEAVPLPELCEECWETVATADATLAVETEREIRADRSRLRQLLENCAVSSI